MRLSEAQKEAVAGRYPNAKLSRVGAGWFVIGFHRKNVNTLDGYRPGWWALKVEDVIVATETRHVWVSEVGYGFQTRRKAVDACRIS